MRVGELAVAVLLVAFALDRRLLGVVAGHHKVVVQHSFDKVPVVPLRPFLHLRHTPYPVVSG